jgi:hypothetical protein
MSQDPNEHELKCWPPFFEHVRTGRKTFEVRRIDRMYLEGDTLRLREYAPPVAADEAEGLPARDGYYTGREVRRKVVYVLHDWTFIEPDAAPVGVCVLGIEPVDQTTVRAEGQTVYIERHAPGDISFSGFRFDVCETDSAAGVAAALGAALDGKSTPALQIVHDIAQQGAELRRVRDALDELAESSGAVEGALIQMLRERGHEPAPEAITERAAGLLDAQEAMAAIMKVTGTQTPAEARRYVTSWRGSMNALRDDGNAEKPTPCDD